MDVEPVDCFALKLNNRINSQNFKKVMWNWGPDKKNCETDLHAIRHSGNGSMTNPKFLERQRIFQEL